MTKKQKRAAKIKAQRAITDAVRAAGRDQMTEEEQRQFDALQAEIDALTAEIDAEERQHAEPDPAPAPDNTDATRQAAIAEERRRISEITALCRDFEINPDAFISNGSTVDQTRAAVLEQLRSTGAPARTGRVEVTHDEGDKFRDAASDALMIRSGRAPEHPAEGARDLAGMSLRDLAIDALTRGGTADHKTASEYLRMGTDALYSELSREFFNPTAAFPAILDSAINKSIVHIYNTVNTTFERITTKGTLRDFKRTDAHSYLIGGFGDLLLVPENGELKADTHQETMLPQRKLDTYGRQFSMSRQAFINDDIGFLSEVPGAYARKAKRQINRQVYSILYNNAPIYDGKTLFHADHGNLMTTASAPSIAAIQSAILKMQMQTDPFGEQINVTPDTIILPVGYDFLIETILNSTTVQTEENTQAVNALYQLNRRRPFEIVADATLNGLAGSGACPWFLKAASGDALGIQVDYLNGQETPTFRRSEPHGQLGFVWDIWLDWGIAVMDYRGFVKNPGAALPTL